MKMRYGIDLGLTHSAICRMEQGEPVIIKTDSLQNTMPSCVSVTRKGAIIVGDRAINQLKSEKSWRSESSNTYVEFKRTMGTNKVYNSSNLNRDLTSEELSAEVLKTLKSFVKDDVVDSAVITIPSSFSSSQKAATLEAAKLAGIEHCELLQEPIAASMVYGLFSGQKDGIWMVFDFDSSSFDASLIKVENGIMQIFDTDGDNYLGSKNLDESIVKHILIPYLQANFSIESILDDKHKSQELLDSLQYYAYDIGMLFSNQDYADVISNLGDLGVDDDGSEIELELTITKAQVLDAIRPCFLKAIKICYNLLERNNLSSDQISKLILIGGPNQSPLIDQMLREQLTFNVDTSADPSTAIAKGAAIYASTIDSLVKHEDVKQNTVHLDIGYESVTVETTEWISVKLLDNSMAPVMVEFVRSDNAWSSGKIEINTLGNVIEVQLLENKPNSFSIVAYDQKGNQLPCFPNEINICYAIVYPFPILPYAFAIGYRDVRTGLNLLRSINGLERNRPIPAAGVITDIMTDSQLRPGNKFDSIKIPIFQTDGAYDLIKLNLAILHEHVADFVITGEDVTAQIPKGSKLCLTLKVDHSEMITMEAYFPSFDLRINKELIYKKLSVDELIELNERDLFIAQQKVKLLNANGYDTSFANMQMNAVINYMLNSSYSPQDIHQQLKSLLRELFKKY